MEKKNKFTLLYELGEFLLIDKLTEKNKILNESTIKAIGDDAAVIKYPAAEATVVSSDMLVENIHFSLVYTPLKYVGYKAVVVNLSDIYAMNAKPAQIVFSFAVSSRFTYEALKELYEGVYQACENYGVDLVGGDTTSSLSGMIISVTAIGHAQPSKIVYRNQAKPGDLICVSGDLGAAYMGLQLLEREKKIIQKNPDIKPDWQGKEYILQRQLRPEARKDIIELFDKQHIKPNSMIDISDGLSSEILHICTQSGVGAKIFEDRLPIDMETKEMAEEMNIDPTIAAMNGGEDYELLFTLPQEEYTKIKDFPGITVIGNIVEDKSYINLIARNGVEIPIIAQGWNAYQDT